LNKLEHISVFLPEVSQFFDLSPGAKVVDGTLGLGGHALHLLPQIGPSGHYYGFDLDQENLDEATRRLANHSTQTTFFHDNFSNSVERLNEIEVTQVDAILLDLGLSSPHIDEAERGFSILQEGPLDMRFDRSQGITAADVLNTWPEDDLKQIIYKYGEERYAPKIARLVVEQRKEKPFEMTSQLMDLIEIFMKSSGDRRRVATRVFQALRIAVNDELTVLETTLPKLLELLSPGGRMVVLSYHSLEDRIVKNVFRDAAKACICPSELLRCECPGESRFKVLTRKPVVPTDEEIEQNSRSRSAKLRAIEKK
jgi:16S rRNA (cytosine1402-N4)-methyltransferase